MGKKACLAPAERFDQYSRLISTQPDIEIKGAGTPYTSLNGNMFTFLSETGALALRLPKGERERFLKDFNTAIFVAHGAVLKEYVAVPESLLENTELLKPYLAMSYEYVKTLKPKPGKAGNV